MRSITEQPVKNLGKVFNSNLKDTTAMQKFTQELGMWLSKVDRSGLPDRFKAWIYQHSILPRVLWPLMVYAVPFSTVEFLKRKISSFLRRWLGLPRSLTSETPSCPLCSGRGRLEHLLSSCTRALADGRYHWRHDKVLKAVAESLASAINTNNGSKKAVTWGRAITGEGTIDNRPFPHSP